MTKLKNDSAKNHSPAPETGQTKRGALAMLRLWAMPVLLAIIALVHMARVRAYHQTPWKGGGFGMFSTIDKPSSRFFRCTLMTPDGNFPVTIPTSHQKLAERLKIAPSPGNLKKIGNHLLATSWQLEDGALHPVQSVDSWDNHHPPGMGKVKVTGATVEVWRLRMASDGPRLTGELVDQVTVKP